MGANVQSNSLLFPNNHCFPRGKEGKLFSLYKIILKNSLKLLSDLTMKEEIQVKGYKAI
jgi:hypothetical protein